MAKLSMSVVDYMMDEDADFDKEMEEMCRKSVSSKEVKIKSMRDSGEVVGNDNHIRHHRKY